MRDISRWHKTLSEIFLPFNMQQTWSLLLTGTCVDNMQLFLHKYASLCIGKCTQPGSVCRNFSPNDRSWSIVGSGFETKIMIEVKVFLRSFRQLSRTFPLFMLFNNLRSIIICRQLRIRTWMHLRIATIEHGHCIMLQTNHFASYAPYPFFVIELTVSSTLQL